MIKTNIAIALASNIGDVINAEKVIFVFRKIFFLIVLRLAQMSERELYVMNKVELIGPKPVEFQQFIPKFLKIITKESPYSLYDEKIKRIIKDITDGLGRHERMLTELYVYHIECQYDIFLLNHVFPSLKCSYFLNRSDFLIMCRSLWQDVEKFNMQQNCASLYTKSFKDAYMKTSLFQRLENMDDINLLRNDFKGPREIYRFNDDGCTCASRCFICKSCKELSIQCPRFDDFIDGYMGLIVCNSENLERFTDDMILQTIYLFLAYIKSYNVCEAQFSTLFMLCHAYILKGDFDWLDLAIKKGFGETFINKKLFILLFTKVVKFFYDCKNIPPVHVQKLYKQIVTTFQ